MICATFLNMPICSIDSCRPIFAMIADPLSLSGLSQFVRSVPNWSLRSDRPPCVACSLGGESGLLWSLERPCRSCSMVLFCYSPIWESCEAEPSVMFNSAIFTTCAALSRRTRLWSSACRLMCLSRKSSFWDMVHSGGMTGFSDMFGSAYVSAFLLVASKTEMQRSWSTIGLAEAASMGRLLFFSFLLLVSDA